MTCRRCGSRHVRNDFGGEVAVHFPGIEGLEKPVVWVFPKLAVCLDCGFAEFDIPEDQLEQLNVYGYSAQSA